MQNKSVILLQPPDVCKTFTRSGSIYPPLGLCQLAAVDRGNIMQVIDAEGEGLTDQETENRLKKIKPKIIGLTATSFTLEIVEKWAKFAKMIKAVVIVGGPHPSLRPVSTFENCPSVDFIVRGEGEVIINELVSGILKDENIELLSGVCFRRGNAYHISNEILKVNDFSILPFPRYTELPIHKYWCPDSLQNPMVTMMTARGCPYRCEFCSSPAVMGKKIRGWSVSQVISELKFLQFELGIKEVSFVDDVFTINRKRILNLCSEMVKNKINLSWFCNARADHIDDEMAAAMKLAGCHQTYLGFESGSQLILNTIKKGTTVERLTEGAEILKKNEIKRSIGFVIGLPGESHETVLESIKLAKKLRPERLQFTRFTPLVGSPLQNYQINESGFHKKGDDQVGQWILEAYNECNDIDWGAESW